MSEMTVFEELFAAPLRNGVSYPSRTRGSGVPMVNMREIFAYDRISDNDCELVPLTETEKESYLLEDGDLLFARQSLTYEGAGKCALVLGSSTDRTWESHLIRVRLDQDKAWPSYYYYYFRSSQGRRSIEAIIQQVAAAGIRGSDLRRLRVPNPSLAEQRATAEVLVPLDDKIGANTKRMETIDRYLAAVFGEIRSRCEQQGFLRDVADINGASVKPVAGGTLRYIDIASVGVGDYEYPDVIAWEEAPSRARRGVRKGDTIWSTVRPNR
jgi:hypothetical protein